MRPGERLHQFPEDMVEVWYVSLRGNIEIRCFVPADAT
jgi:hypothetical protein